LYVITVPVGNGNLKQGQDKGWRFYPKPGGLEVVFLEYLELTFAVFFYFFGFRMDVDV
jgi:hypothetical protein